MHTRRYCFLLMLFSAVVVAFAGCDKDDDNGLTDTTPAVSHKAYTYQTGTVCGPEGSYTVHLLHDNASGSQTIWKVVNPELISAGGFENGDILAVEFASDSIFPAAQSPDAPWTDCQPDFYQGRRIRKISRYNGPGSCMPITVAETFPWAVDVPEVQPTGQPWLADSCVAIPVGYSGCNLRPQDFRLYWNGAVMESYPTQARLAVFDTYASDATCAAYFMDTLYFSATPFLQPGVQPIVLHIGEYSLRLPAE